MGFSKMMKKAKRLGHKVKHGLNKANKIGEKGLQSVRKGTEIGEKVLKVGEQVADVGAKAGIPQAQTLRAGLHKGRQALAEVEKLEKLGEKALDTSKKVHHAMGAGSMSDAIQRGKDALESAKETHVMAKGMKHA